MGKMDMKRVKKVLSRVKKSDDGPELMDYLRQLSSENYEAFKGCDPKDNESHKGYALCIDSLIESFEKSEDETPIKKRDTSHFT